MLAIKKTTLEFDTFSQNQLLQFYMRTTGEVKMFKELKSELLRVQLLE